MDRPALILTLLTACLLSGCKGPQPEEAWTPTSRPAKPPKDYARPLGPGEMALKKIRPEFYPDFRPAFSDYAGLETAIRHSLDYLGRKSSKRYFPYLDVSHERAERSLREFLRVMQEARSADQFDGMIRERFEVYQSVGYDGEGTVFFTGYYTPIFDGRKQRDAVFRYPLYRLPPDLVKNEEGETLGRRLPDGGLTPYYTRREIEQGGLLDGTEIAWLKDPFEAYVVSVQGSARLRLADGTLWELGYAGVNGHEYTPVAYAMIEDGLIDRNQLSLQTLLDYFHAHPEQVAPYTQKNDRFTFFQETRGGPYGSINVPVTPRRSLATDKQVFPRACLAFVTAKLPSSTPTGVEMQDRSAFLLDQDAGGAIRAAGRADIYYGVGPASEALAGRTGAEGGLYYLFVK